MVAVIGMQEPGKALPPQGSFGHVVYRSKQARTSGVRPFHVRSQGQLLRAQGDCGQEEAHRRPLVISKALPRQHPSALAASGCPQPTHGPHQHLLNTAPHCTVGGGLRCRPCSSRVSWSCRQTISTTTGTLGTAGVTRGKDESIPRKMT